MTRRERATAPVEQVGRTAPSLRLGASAAVAALDRLRTPEPRPLTTSERFDPAERRARRARGRAQKAARRTTRRCGR